MNYLKAQAKSKGKESYNLQLRDPVISEEYKLKGQNLSLSSLENVLQLSVCTTSWICQMLTLTLKLPATL